MKALRELIRKTAPYIMAIGLGTSLFSCRETKTELSDVLHEDAKVISMYHRNRYFVPIPMGKMIGLMPHQEVNEIKFEGDIDFSLDDEKIFKRFKEGDNADVSYREIYKLTFEDLNKDGIKEQTSKYLEGYKFIDATPK